MSLRHGICATAALVIAVTACASTQELSDDAPALDGIHADASSSNAGGDTSPGGGDGSGGTSDTTSSGGSSVTSSSGGSGESGSGGHAASSSDAGSARGGRQSGGATSSGGARSSSGGTRSSSGGSSAPGDAPDGSTCTDQQKLCPGDSQCRVPSPAIGCDPAGPCTACAAAPANGFSKCTGTMCDFDCLSGFRRDAAGTGCESDTGAGGTGNASGGRTGRGGRTSTGGNTSAGGSSTGGSTSTCNARDCPDCNSLLQAPCCHRDGTCGCGLLGIGVLCGN